MLINLKQQLGWKKVGVAFLTMNILIALSAIIFTTGDFVADRVVFTYQNRFTDFDDYIAVTYVEYLDSCVGDTTQGILYARDIDQTYWVELKGELFILENENWEELNIQRKVDTKKLRPYPDGINSVLEDEYWRELNISRSFTGDKELLYQKDDGRIFGIDITWPKPFTQEGTYTIVNSLRSEVRPGIVKEGGLELGTVTFKVKDCDQ